MITLHGVMDEPTAGMMRGQGRSRVPIRTESARSRTKGASEEYDGGNRLIKVLRFPADAHSRRARAELAQDVDRRTVYPVEMRGLISTAFA